jgi:hypothetical protein
VAVNTLVPEWRIGGGAMIGALVVLPFALMLWRGACAGCLKARPSIGRCCWSASVAWPRPGWNVERRTRHRVRHRGASARVSVERGCPARRRASHASLLAFVRQARIDHVVIALDDSRGKLPFDELLRCKFSGVKIEDGLSFYERITGRVHLDALKPSWMIFSDGFGRPRITAVFKRVCDVVGSLVGLSLSLRWAWRSPP